MQEERRRRREAGKREETSSWEKWRAEWDQRRANQTWQLSVTENIFIFLEIITLRTLFLEITTLRTLRRKLLTKAHKTLLRSRNQTFLHINQRDFQWLFISSISSIHKTTLEHFTTRHIRWLKGNLKRKQNLETKVIIKTQGAPHCLLATELKWS